MSTAFRAIPAAIYSLKISVRRHRDAAASALYVIDINSSGFEPETYSFSDELDGGARVDPDHL